MGAETIPRLETDLSRGPDFLAQTSGAWGPPGRVGRRSVVNQRPAVSKSMSSGSPSENLLELTWGAVQVSRHGAVVTPVVAFGGFNKQALTPPIYRLNEGRISGGKTRARAPARGDRTLGTQRIQRAVRVEMSHGIDFRKEVPCSPATNTLALDRGTSCG